VPKAYWWKEVPNFGDKLAPLLLERFADLEPEWSPIREAEIASVGSIIEHIPAGWTGHIVGSGLLRETSKLKFDPSQVNVLAVRGPLTARSFTGSFGIGDPGILANELIEYQEKQWDLGIVPHWQDNELADKFLALIPEQFSCKIIHPSQDPLTVITEIAQCKRIVTSSLHGMIVADAIGGIPRRVEYCDKLDKDGSDFKFRDYSASIQTPFEFGKMIEPSRNRVNEVKYEIYDAYRELNKIYDGHGLRDQRSGSSAFNKVR
jgi:pyruvyltransferase